MIQAKDLCLCSVPPLLFYPHISSCLQTFAARTTIVGQQRMFSRLRGWRRKLVNTSLQQRGAIDAGTNCDDFKVGAVHYEFSSLLSPPK